MTIEPDRAVAAPLVDAWRQARAAARRPMQVPGHKMRFVDGAAGWAHDLVGDTVRDDIPLQGGVDDNAYSHGYLDKAEELWARAIGADFSRFLVGGSSQGNIAALAAIADQHVPIAIDRTSHRSTQAGLVLIGARPVWVYRLFELNRAVPVQGCRRVVDVRCPWLSGIWMLRSTQNPKESQGHGRAYVVVVGAGRTRGPFGGPAA